MPGKSKLTADAKAQAAAGAIDRVFLAASEALTHPYLARCWARRGSADAALAMMRSMATRWPDADIAATLNRMGMPTGQGKTWTAHRVSSVRRVNGIHAYRSAEKSGEWLTMSEAAAGLGVTHHRIRRLIRAGILSAEQVVPGAPYQIRAADLQDER